MSSNSVPNASEDQEDIILPDDSLEGERFQALALISPPNRPRLHLSSNKGFTASSTESTVAPGSRHSFDPAQLPCMSETQKRLDPFLNIPQPPWVLASDRSDTPRFWASSLDACRLPLKPSSNIYDKTRTWRNFAKSSSSANSPAKSTSQGVTTLTVPIPAQTGFEGLEHPYQPNPSHCADLLDDDPEVLTRMWKDFASVVDSRPRSFDHLKWKPPTESKTKKQDVTDVDTPIEPNMSIAVCPTPLCTAVIPAALYHQRPYLEHFSNTMSPTRGHELIHPITSLSLPEPSGLSELVTLINDLGLSQQHAVQCPCAAAEEQTPITDTVPSAGLSPGMDANFEIPADNESIRSFGLTSLFEEFEEFEDPATDNNSDMMTIELPNAEFEDSAYFSTHESEWEVACSEPDASEDAWEDFDWDAEDQWGDALSQCERVFGDWDIAEEAEGDDWAEIHRRLA